MGIFSGLFKSRDKPTDSTVGSRYTFYMGGSTSGKTVILRSNSIGGCRGIATTPI